MIYQFENRTEMVQQVGEALKGKLRSGLFNVKPVSQGKRGSLEIKVTENYPDSKETLTFNFNEPNAGNNGGWAESKRPLDGDRYNIHLSAGTMEGVAERANCKMDYTNEQGGVCKVEAVVVGTIAEIMALKISEFFHIAKNRMHNITPNVLAIFESDGWEAGYDGDGIWRLRKTTNDWDYVLYPCPNTNKLDPPRIDGNWIVGLRHDDYEEEVIGIKYLTKAKLVLEWHIEAKAK